MISKSLRWIPPTKAAALCLVFNGTWDNKGGRPLEVGRHLLLGALWRGTEGEVAQW